MKKSPAYNAYDKSGECFCGAHAQEWELMQLKKNDPMLFDTIKWLEKEIIRTREYMIFVTNASESDIANWCRIFYIKHLKDTLEPYQLQIARLTMFNHWGKGQATKDIEAQTDLEQFFGGDITVSDDYCGESCQAD